MSDSLAPLSQRRYGKFHQFSEKANAARYISTWDYIPSLGCYVSGYYTDNRCTAGMDSIIMASGASVKFYMYSVPLLTSEQPGSERVEYGCKPPARQKVTSLGRMPWPLKR